MKTGATSSTMVKVPLAVVLLLQSSVAVQITVTDPVAPQAALMPSKLWVIVTSPHISVAEALSSHAFRASVLPFPSHSTTIFAGTTLKVGAV